jgi:hypothetical protein
MLLLEGRETDRRTDSPAGDLLRAERARPGSTYGTMITEYIQEGKIVPMEVTIKVCATSVLSCSLLYDRARSDLCVLVTLGAANTQTASRERHARSIRIAADLPRRLAAFYFLGGWTRAIPHRWVPPADGPGRQV